MSNSSRGIARERAVQDLMQAEGWVVARCAGSKGEYDLMASRARRYELEPGVKAYTLDACEVWLVEVKSTTAGPFCDFGPSDRAELSAAAAQAGADAWLCWWPKRSKPQWFGEAQWPKSRAAAA